MRWYRPLLILLVLFVFLGTLIGGAFFISITYNLPKPEEITERKIVESTKIYDRTGEVLLYEIHGEEKRTFVPFEDIPADLKNATISIEDDTFYTHPAIDIRGIIRSAVNDILSASLSQGGSTITQQLAKNVFLSREKTITRKLKELVLAYRLEKRYTKDEILHLYLNQIPYGPNLYGIESATQAYFGKTTKDMTLNEAALLAALPQAPSYYSPWGNHVDELEKRKDYVLKRMRDLGYIDAEQFETNYGIYPDIIAQSKGSIRAPHFVMYIQEYLRKKYGEEFLQTGGLKIVTTLDWKLQEFAEKAVTEGVARNTELYDGRNGSLIAIDPQTGQILAMVGSADYFNTENDGNFNVAVQGLRQPGSTFKPFAYVTAFQKGLTPDTIVWDVHTNFDTTGNPEMSYEPHNYDDVFVGPITIKEALAQSRNIPAVKALYLAGMKDTLENAASFGITTLNDPARFGLSLVLGGGEVTLLELTSAYGVFAAEGIHHETASILSVQSAEGETLESFTDSSREVIDPQYPRLINDILSNVDLRSPLYTSSLSLTQVPGHQVALKTGTTNDYVDAWAVGYTPDLVVGVWAGNNHREPLQQRGGSVLAAVPMWHAFMEPALQDRPLTTFTKPAPTFTDNPILRGELPKLQDGEHYHSILYYLGRINDPQFNNWEVGVSSWLQTHTVDASRFSVAAFSENSSSSSFSSGTSAIRIALLTPENGSFISQGTLIPVTATIHSSLKIEKIQLYFNGALLHETNPQTTGVPMFTYSFKPEHIKLQNLLSLIVTDSTGVEEKKDILLYSK